MGERIGGVFERGEQLRERLRAPPPASQPPAESAQPPPPVPPSRWKLASIGTTFAFLHGDRLPGVSLDVRHCGIVLRQGRPQYYSPDPAYLEKEACLLHALAQVACQPQEQVGLFLDELSYTRWPPPSSDWCAQAPAPRPVADRKQSR